MNFLFVRNHTGCRCLVDIVALGIMKSGFINCYVFWHVPHKFATSDLRITTVFSKPSVRRVVYVLSDMSEVFESCI